MKKIYVVLFLLIALPAWAQVYSYVDDNGVTVFTNSLSDVPFDKREQAPSFEEMESKVTAAPKQNAAQAASDEDKTESASDNNAGYQKLMEEKKVLDEEYAKLVSEQQALQQEVPGKRNVKANKAYSEKVMALNGKIEAFNAKRAAFDKRVQAHNEKLRSKPTD